MSFKRICLHWPAAATHLINTEHVQAILGPRTWEETSLVSEIGSRSHTPILSFADSAPWAETRWPFLIHASPSQHAQMKAVAAIVQSWGWHRVIVIYEDIDSAASGVIPYLHNSLQETGIEISLLVPLPHFSSSSSSSSISEELDKLKRGQCRVFVVHTSLRLATLLFHKAKEMEMVEKDYVWITTDTITSLVHAFDSSTISSMQGILGVKSYFLETGPHFYDFSIRFAKKFSYENPEEKNHGPGVFALQAYNATRALAIAIAHGGIKKGLDLLDKIVLSNDFDGLSGNNSTQFTERKLAPAHVFEIINIVGKSYKEIGFWSESSDGFGFSSGITIDGRSATNYYSDSMEKLGQVFWPGELRSTPKGWTLPTSANKLRIGVPNGTMFNLFTTVRYDQLTHNYTIAGLAIDIFKATVELLPYDLPYDLFPFDGTYDELVEQVYLKKFHAAIGGIAITAERYNHVDFSQPHTDGALVMIVPVQPQLSRKAWLFLKPFTTAMWILTAFINVYNGFVIWMIERDHCPELSGSALDQVGTLLWLSFTTLFSTHGEKPRSNLSRMATVVWLFVALIVTQTYTANLTSMLTVQRLEPTVADIGSLKHNRAMVGCSRRSFVKNYLAGVLGFNSDYIKKYSTPEDLSQALRSKEIGAAFLESPWAKLFLARYCKSFIAAGPAYKIGGYGFVFPKGSPMLSDINTALLELVDSGKLRELENSVTPTEICVDVESDDNCHDNISLSPNSFLVLFIFTVGVSTVALVMYLIPGQISKFYNSMRERCKTVWILIFAIKKYCWWLQKNQFVSTRNGDVEARNPQIQL